MMIWDADMHRRHQSEMENLKRLLRNAEKDGQLAIIFESETDILTDDFCFDKHIPYHLIPPSMEWLSSKILWGSSIKGALPEWTQLVADALLKIDTNMLTCLNRVCILGGECDVGPVCKVMDASEESFPEKIFLDEHEYLGCLWSMENSVIIDLHAIYETVESLAPERTATSAERARLLKEGFWITLFHGIRNLGLNCNPFLSAVGYPEELYSEQEVEEWARETYENIILCRNCRTSETVCGDTNCCDCEDTLDR